MSLLTQRVQSAGKACKGQAPQQLPINTMMTNTQICEMLWVMGEMTKEACEGTNFLEISTYVKNHCPGIEPSFIEVFRDFITPIVRQHSIVNYEVIGQCGGMDAFRKDGFKTVMDAEDWIREKKAETTLNVKWCVYRKR